MVSGAELGPNTGLFYYTVYARGGKTRHNFVRLYFLGRTESFTTGIVSFSMISRASILPMFCVRGRNRQTSVLIERPIDIQVNTDRQRRSENGIG
jgi:hypothetical protein